ncbi:DUF6355 family natural product biosynthesis protein [Streptomyces sp. NPDC002276]
MERQIDSPGEGRGVRATASAGAAIVGLKVRVARARDHEACVRPGTTWLGSARKIQGAYYVGRVC